MKGKKAKGGATNRTDNVRALKKLKRNHNAAFKRKEERKWPPIDPQAGKLIAVTGGIGSGKSFILGYLEKLGFVVFNADRAIHQMLMLNGAAYKEVAEIFPTAINKDGIDRKILSEIVFNDVQKLSKLEAILHPKLRHLQLQLMIEVKKTSGKSIAYEVPLLFENKRINNYDYIILATAKFEVRKTRVLQRNNMTEDKFNAIIKAQVSDKVRLKGSHFVIRTDISDTSTLHQIRSIVKNDKRNSIRHRNNGPRREKR